MDKDQEAAMLAGWDSLHERGDRLRKSAGLPPRLPTNLGTAQSYCQHGLRTKTAYSRAKELHDRCSSRHPDEPDFTSKSPEQCAAEDAAHFAREREESDRMARGMEEVRIQEEKAYEEFLYQERRKKCFNVVTPSGVLCSNDTLDRPVEKRFLKKPPSTSPYRQANIGPEHNQASGGPEKRGGDLFDKVNNFANRYMEKKAASTAASLVVEAGVAAATGNPSLGRAAGTAAGGAVYAGMTAKRIYDLTKDSEPESDSKASSLSPPASGIGEVKTVNNVGKNQSMAK